MFIRSVLVLGIAGLCTCTGFLLLVTIALLRFRRPRYTTSPSSSTLPPVTLLKPLCGLEPNLRENLASFFAQNYPSFEIVFGMRDSNDPALRVLRSVQAEYPWVPVQVVFSGTPERPNAKVWSLEKMLAKASYDYLVISDSDVRVSTDYIEAVVKPLLDPATGLVTCVYRGVPTGGLWSRLEALGMSVEMTAGVLASDLLEGMKFALGPTMAIRAEVLDAIGGFGAIGDYCADDYVLGNLVHQAGWKVELSDHAIDHFVLNRSFSASILHQVRWMKSARFSRPGGHIASVLSFGMPFALLAAFAAAIMHHGTLAVVLLTCGILNRTIMSLLVGWKAVGDLNSLRYCWLFPVRDLMGFFFWAVSFVGNTVLWRNQTYALRAGGKMIPIYEGGELMAEPASAPVAVDQLS
jgi:ceramide glucosyltransferase